MRGFYNEAWVTFALSDIDVPRALTLSWSLKHVLTTRKLVVIASPQLSRSLKESLHLGFDFVFYLQPDLKPDGISEYDFGKLTAFTLISFEKIALVSSNMMVTRNCDELFDGKVKEGMIWMENREVPVAVIKPSINTNNALLKAIQEKRRNAAAANFSNTVNSLQCGIISLKNGFFVGEEKDVCIVNLEGISIEELKAKKNLGVLESVSFPYITVN
ncbi:unnamed protein product [Orchesella dallaii]|uniref:Uncharacterized protein n=1 Tax=Orchesella dallaii TaxID=48710 RepID=A0ABP1RMG7_9HEXA